MKLFKNHRNNGSSIIELTIVLMVMSVLIASVLASATLIKEAKIRSIIAQLTHFENAISDFQKVYKQLPGDFSHTYIWANEDIANTCYKIKDTNGTIATGADRPDQAFIKGDGNGLVLSGADMPGGTTKSEAELVTCHLVLSGTLSNTPNVGLGITSGDVDWYKTPKENKYKAGYFVDNTNRLSLMGSSTANKTSTLVKGNAIYLTSSIPTPATSDPNYDPDYYSKLVANNNSQFNNTLPFDILMAIDIKMDDGKPGTGQIVFTNNKDHNAFGPICNKIYATGNNSSNSLCTPDSTFSTDIANNAKGRAILVYRPRWLNSEW